MSCHTCNGLGVDLAGDPCHDCNRPERPPVDTAPSDPLAQTWWTATDLMGADLPELVYAVEGLIPEGLSLLVGAPKVGKSWAALGLALAVASGGYALGKVPVVAGDVLYLALEDGPRRLRDRLAKLLGDQPPPGRLTFAVEVPAIGDGLAAVLDGWVGQVDAPRLVVVDVLAKIKPPSDGRGSAYGEDYAALAPLQQWATRNRIAVVVVHHTRKAKDDDWLASVSGTHGLAGASDAVLVLARSRTSADAVLAVTGRDVAEAEHALTFDPQLGAWRLLGDAGTYALSAERRAILDAVTAAGSARPKAIAEASGVDYEVVRKLVVKMADAGQLDTDGQGVYLPPPRLYPVPSVPSQGTQGTGGMGYTGGGPS